MPDLLSQSSARPPETAPLENQSVASSSQLLDAGKKNEMSRWVMPR
jgi:hypothetical protein